MHSLSDDLINRPEVEAIVRNVLRRCRLQGEWMDDAVQEVKLRALEAARGERPDSVERWQKLCRTVARAYAVDTVRRQIAGRKVIVGLTAEADDAPRPERRSAEDAIDIRRKLDVFADLHRAGRLPAESSEILDALQAGVSGPEIAEELGVPYRRLRKYVARIREQMNMTLVERGLAVAFVVWVVVCARSVHLPDRLPGVLDPPRASHHDDVAGDTRPVAPPTRTARPLSDAAPGGRGRARRPGPRDGAHPYGRGGPSGASLGPVPPRYPRGRGARPVPRCACGGPRDGMHREARPERHQGAQRRQGAAVNERA